MSDTGTRPWFSAGAERSVSSSRSPSAWASSMTKWPRPWGSPPRRPSRSVCGCSGMSSVDPATRRHVIDALNVTSEQLAGEISLCLRYYTVTFRGKRVERAVVAGGGAYEQVLRDALRRHLSVEVEVAEPLRGFEYCPDKIDKGGPERLCGSGPGRRTEPERAGHVAGGAGRIAGAAGAGAGGPRRCERARLPPRVVQRRQASPGARAADSTSAWWPSFS